LLRQSTREDPFTTERLGTAIEPPPTCDEADISWEEVLRVDMESGRVITMTSEEPATVAREPSRLLRVEQLIKLETLFR
jgi:hypothetical protein